jgi:NADH dehydrogenase FAD-containing subunit
VVLTSAIMSRKFTTSSDDTKAILILGGSYGGISVAHYLLKHIIPRLPDPSSYQVIMISASSEALCRTAAPRAMLSDEFFNQSKLFVSIPAQFEQYGRAFRFLHGTVAEVEHLKRKVSILPYNSGKESSSNGSITLDYHALVIATGSTTGSPLFSLINGTSSTSSSMTTSPSDTLRETWNTFRTALPAAKHIVIGGGGPTGVETAGEIADFLLHPPSAKSGGMTSWLTSWFSSSNTTKPKTTVTLISSNTSLIPDLRPAIAAEAEGYLRALGVTIIKSARVNSVSPENAGTTIAALTTPTTITLSTGKTLQADIYIPAFGMHPNANFMDKSLLTKDGKIETSKQTLRVEAAGERVYAVGDVASYARPAVHILVEIVPIVCNNIARDLLWAAGQDPRTTKYKEDRYFKEDKREMQLVPVGRSKGVGAAMGWRVPSIMVWAIKGRDYWMWSVGAVWSGKQWEKEK